ncbi:MAG: hypothetical protein WCO10_00220 [bacterium]
MGNESLHWQAPEYHHYERSVDWFWAVGIITICIVILSFMYGNSLFGILILLSVFMLIYFVRREPGLVDYDLANMGITIGNELHPYQTLEAFWVELRHGNPTLIIQSKKKLQPLISIPLNGANPDEVHAFLSQYLDEVELQEPVAHKVMDYLGF